MGSYSEPGQTDGRFPWRHIPTGTYPWEKFSILWHSSVYAMGDFDTLYAQHLPVVFRYALRCVGRRDIAEEVTAEAFLALHSNFDRIDPAQLPGWLLTVVKNRSVDYWRRVQLEQRHQNAEYRGASDVPVASAAEPLGEELTGERWLLEQCTNLKPIHRACLLLRFVRGMTRQEVARELGLTDNQVKGALQYGLELLRKSYPESRAAADRGND